MLENAVQYPDLDEIVQKSERKTVYKKLVRRTKLDRRTQILQVVLQMLQEDDYKQVSMSRIAEKVGISEAAIYRNYRNKSAIFSSVVDFVETTLLDLFGKIRDDKTTSPLVHVQQMVNVLLEFVDANPGLCRILLCQDQLMEDLKLRRRMLELLKTLETRIRLEYRAAMESGLLPMHFNEDARAQMVMCFIEGRWFRTMISGFKDKAGGVPPIRRRSSPTRRCDARREERGKRSRLRFAAVFCRRRSDPSARRPIEIGRGRTQESEVWRSGSFRPCGFPSLSAKGIL